MKIKKRYHFWKVFWVVLAVDILFTLIGVLALILAPQEGVTLNHVFHWKNLLREAASLAFGTAFFYYTLNYFYSYFVEKKGYVYFLRVGALAALGCIAFTVLSYFESCEQAAFCSKLHFFIRFDSFESHKTSRPKNGLLSSYH